MTSSRGACTASSEFCSKGWAGIRANGPENGTSRSGRDKACDLVDGELERTFVTGMVNRAEQVELATGVNDLLVFGNRYSFRGVQHAHGSFWPTKPHV